MRCAFPFFLYGILLLKKLIGYVWKLSLFVTYLIDFSLDWRMELFWIRSPFRMILLIWPIIWVSSCMTIYWRLCLFAIRRYTFCKSGILATLLMYDQLVHFVVKMISFFSLQILRLVSLYWDFDGWNFLISWLRLSIYRNLKFTYEEFVIPFANNKQEWTNILFPTYYLETKGY